jgi:phage terminase large subunit-like protein
VTLTQGNVIDYQAIKSQIVSDAKTYRIEQIAADRWNLEALRQQLEAEGGPKFVEFGQGFRDMSEPAKELERLVVSGQLAHDGNEVLRWMVGNVAIKRDEASNIKPDREKSRDKIDGVVALTMAIGRAMRDVPDRPLTAEDILG